MKRYLLLAYVFILFLSSCQKETEKQSFTHQGPQGEAYSSSIFVATDRHENGKGNNLTAMLQFVTANKSVLLPRLVLLGGDYVGGFGNMTPQFSIDDLRSEVYMVMKESDCDLLMTYGSHDRNCIEGYNVFFSGPHRGDGYYVYGISYAQMTFANDSVAQTCIDLYKNGDDSDTARGETPPPPSGDSTGTPPPPSPKTIRAYSGIDAIDPFGISAESATRRFSAWVSSLSDHAPIVVMSHVPIHSNRNDNPGGMAWFDALQRASQSHDVLLLFGHNHSLEERGNVSDQQVYLLVPGDSISVQGDSITGVQRLKMNFTYANAGYLKLGHASMITFTDKDGDGQYDDMSIRRFSLDGDNVSLFGTTSRNNPYTLPLKNMR